MNANSDKVCQNIRDAYNQVSRTDVLEGKDWYRTARQFAQELSELSGLPLDVVIGVIAVVSPGTNWNQNMIIATQIVGNSDKVSCRYWLNVIKARKIIQNSEVFPTLKGNKVTRFYRNISNPDTSMDVTVDRWALRTALNDYSLTAVKNDKEYWMVEQAFREVASEIGLLPSELQAILWVWARREFPQ